MNTSHDISVLNSLIETTLDSMKGFTDAAEERALLDEIRKEREHERD